MTTITGIDPWKALREAETLNAELVAALDECIVSMAEHNEAENCAWDFGDGFGGSLDRARAALAKARGEPIWTATPSYYECGICDHYHSASWQGDCREDGARFTGDQLDELHGAGRWYEIDTDKIDFWRAALAKAREPE